MHGTHRDRRRLGVKMTKVADSEEVVLLIGTSSLSGVKKHYDFVVGMLPQRTESCPTYSFLLKTPKRFVSEAKR